MSRNICGVPFAGLESPDKRFAIGWTLVKVQGESPKIDWQRLGEGVDQFLDLYPPREVTEQDSGYSIQNVFLDRKTENGVVLQSSQPMWPGKNRGHISVAWAPFNENGVVALVSNDVRLFTANLWIVEMQQDGVKVTDLVPKLTHQLGQEIHRLTGVRGSGIFFVMEPEQGSPRVVFLPDQIDVFFRAEVPKAEDGSILEGFVTLRNYDGEVVRIRSINQ